MFIIFGWLKEEKHEKSLLDTYCYHCNNNSTWELCSETEWVTFFDIKTIPFLKKNYIVCSKCHDVFDLNKQISNGVNRLHKLSDAKSSQLHDLLVAELEQYQLSNKTERQLEYIRSIRSKHDDAQANNTPGEAPAKPDND